MLNRSPRAIHVCLPVCISHLHNPRAAVQTMCRVSRRRRNTPPPESQSNGDSSLLHLCGFKACEFSLHTNICRLFSERDRERHFHRAAVAAAEKHTEPVDAHQPFLHSNRGGGLHTPCLLRLPSSRPPALLSIQHTYVSGWVGMGPQHTLPRPPLHCPSEVIPSGHQNLTQCGEGEEEQLLVLSSTISVIGNYNYYRATTPPPVSGRS